MPDVIVAGGGITGLTAAYRLTEAGFRVEVVEARTRLGGAIVTEMIEGYPLEGGPDSFLTRIPHARALAEELGLGADLIPTRREARGASLWWQGRMLPIPHPTFRGIPTAPEAVLRSPLFSWWGARRALVDRWWPKTRLTADVSLGAVLDRHFGREVVDRLVEPVMAGIYAGDIRQLSLLATAPELKEALSAAGSLMRGLAAQAARAPRPTGPLFLTLAQGLATLVERLADTIRARGGTFKLGVTVTEIAPAGHRWEVATSAGTLAADAVVVALPAWAAAACVNAAVPAVVAPLEAIPYADLAVVGLLYEPDAVQVPRSETGLLVPRQPGMELTALTYLASKWAYPTPPALEPIRAFYGRAGSPVAAEWSDERLASQAVTDVARILRAKRDPRHVRVFRHPRAMPQYVVGHPDRAAAVDAALEPWPTLALAGSWHAGVGVPNCIRDGEAAAARIVRALRPESSRSAAP
jgi:oxygen-dependent protoporphyrinogen oxidase